MPIHQLSHALAWSGVNGLAALIYIPLNLRHARAWDKMMDEMVKMLTEQHFDESTWVKFLSRNTTPEKMA